MRSASVFRGVVAAAVAGISLALLLPAQAQFWGDWGGRPQRQQQYNNNWNNNWFGGGGNERRYDDRRYYDPYRQEREAPVDYSRAPQSSQKKPEATTSIVVMGDANADWLAYGLEDAFSENPEGGGGRQARHRFRPHSLRSAPRSRVAAGGARDHRGGEAKIHCRDDRKQRPSDDPQKGPACGASSRYAQAECAGGAAKPARNCTDSNSTDSDPAARSGATAARPLRARRTRQHDARAGAPGILCPGELPHVEVGARLYQAHRCDHRRPQERRRSGDVGRPAVAARHQGECRFLLSQRALP